MNVDQIKQKILEARRGVKSVNKIDTYDLAYDIADEVTCCLYEGTKNPFDDKDFSMRKEIVETQEFYLRLAKSIVKRYVPKVKKPKVLTKEFLLKIGFKYTRWTKGGQDQWAGMDIWVCDLDRDFILRGDPGSLKLNGYYNSHISTDEDLIKLMTMLLYYGV